MSRRKFEKKKYSGAFLGCCFVFINTFPFVFFFLHVFVVDLGLVKMKPTKQKHELEGVWLVEMT